MAQAQVFANKEAAEKAAQSVNHYLQEQEMYLEVAVVAVEGGIVRCGDGAERVFRVLRPYAVVLARYSFRPRLVVKTESYPTAVPFAAVVLQAIGHYIAVVVGDKVVA